MSEKKIVYNDGSAYGKMMGVWSQLLGTQFIEWLNPTDGQSWIDIGCGTGPFTAKIAEFCSLANGLVLNLQKPKSNSPANAL